MAKRKLKQKPSPAQESNSVSDIRHDEVPKKKKVLRWNNKFFIPNHGLVLVDEEATEEAIKAFEASTNAKVSNYLK